ncbi:MAG: PIG-L deacetylase family protein [Microgenomates group bacterium]
MKKTAFAIFAHPDDESFGPGGTIALLAKTHNVYLLCATKGEAGEDHSEGTDELPIKREKELRAAAKILGIQNVFFLGFVDGELKNNNYHAVAQKIEELANTYKPELFLTYENRGISGHMDHVAISLISSYVFHKLAFIKEIHYFCLDQEQRGIGQTYFVYFPPGYPENEISRRVDIRSVLQQKIAAIKEHKSQIKDVEVMLQKHKEKRIEECFIIVKK